jgi:hypothetical protein
MKLYSEEQVRLLLDLAKLKLNGEMYSKDLLLEQVEPIELPSDFIKEAANGNIHGYNGAMWLKYNYIIKKKI